jgi:hypothetical protein
MGVIREKESFSFWKGTYTPMEQQEIELRFPFLGLTPSIAIVVSVTTELIIHA